MSQAGIINTSTGPVPPTVPTTFVTDVNSPAVPALNILNVLGNDTTANNVNGIQTDGSSGSNTLTIQLTNRVQGTVTTTDATLTTIITFPLSASTTVYGVNGLIVARDITDSAGGFYAFDSSVRTDGAIATEIGTEYNTQLEDVVMEPSDIFVVVSGNNLILQVQGLVGKTINWYAKFEYIQVV